MSSSHFHTWSIPGGETNYWVSHILLQNSTHTSLKQDTDVLNLVSFRADTAHVTAIKGDKTGHQVLSLLPATRVSADIIQGQLWVCLAVLENQVRPLAPPAPSELQPPLPTDQQACIPCSSPQELGMLRSSQQDLPCQKTSHNGTGTRTRALP